MVAQHHDHQAAEKEWPNNGRKWISVDATDLFKLQNLVVQLLTELFHFNPALSSITVLLLD